MRPPAHHQEDLSQNGTGRVSLLVENVVILEVPKVQISSINIVLAMKYLPTHCLRVRDSLKITQGKVMINLQQPQRLSDDDGELRLVRYGRVAKFHLQKKV